MDSHAFGEQLALLRRRHGALQSEVCREIGWPHPSTLSRIESGRTQVNRETALRLAEALALTPEETRSLLAAGRFVPDDADVRAACTVVEPLLATLPHGAWLLDFRWVVHRANPVFWGMAGDPHRALARMPGFHALEIAVDPTLADPDWYADPPWEAHVASLIGQFRAQNRASEHETWYRAVVRRLLRYPIVRTLWDRVSLTVPRPLVNVGFNRMASGATYMLVSSPLASDPRFELVQSIPTNREAHEETAMLYARGIEALRTAEAAAALAASGGTGPNH